jgi:hypothetical protein
MKLKKVTALLLATSMVLSSVGVTTFADELVFEDEYSATADAGEGEAYFGDDIVEEEATEDDAASDEAFFSDEVIDETVIEDEYVEDVVVEDEAFAFEDVTEVDVAVEDEANADIYEAIALDEQIADTEADYASFTVNVTPSVNSASGVQGSIVYGEDPRDFSVYRLIGATYYDSLGRVVAAPAGNYVLLTYTGTSLPAELKDATVPTINFEYQRYDHVYENDDQTRPAIVYTMSVSASGITYTASNKDVYTFSGKTGNFALTPAPLTLNWRDQTSIYVGEGGSYTFNPGTLDGVLGTDEVYVDSYVVTGGNLPAGGSTFTHGVPITVNASGTYRVTIANVVPNTRPIGGADASNYSNPTNGTIGDAKNWYVLPNMSVSEEYTGRQEHTIDTSSVEAGTLKYFGLGALNPAGGIDINADGTINAADWGNFPSNSDFSDELPLYRNAGKYVVMYVEWDATAGAYKSIADYQIGATGTYSNFAVCEVTPKEVTVAIKNLETTYGTVVSPLTAGDFTIPWVIPSDNTTLVTPITDPSPWNTLGVYGTKIYRKNTAGSWVYYGPAGSLTATTPAGEYKVEFIKNNTTNAIVSDTANNYRMTVEEVLITIAKFALYPTWSTVTKLPYTGNPVTYNGVTNANSAADGSGIYLNGAGGEFVYLDMSNLSKTDVGTYTASIDEIYLSTSNLTAPSFTNNNVARNYVIGDKDKTHEWSITGGKVYLEVVPTTFSSIAYGSADPLSRFTIKDIVVRGAETKNGLVKDQEVRANSWKMLSGTPVFTTTYHQYDDVGVYSVSVTGVTCENYEVQEVKKGSFQVVPAAVTIVPTDIVVPYGEDPAELTYTFEDTNAGSGHAAAAEHDVQEKKFKVKLATDVERPVEIKKYDINATVDPSDYKNINFTTKTGTYEVVKGKLSITFDNYSGVVDGGWHGIVINPSIADLPNDVTVYFSSTKKLVSKVEDANTEALYTTGSTTEVKFKEAGKYTVYYYVDGPNYGLAMAGSKTVDLKAKEKASAEEVEKQIDEAVKKDAEGNYDSDKVKAAREAYDALSADEKKEVDPFKVKALEEAEKAVAEQDAKAAKAVEDQIAALPAPADVTEADKDKIEAAKKAYDALSEDAKAKVSKDAKDKLDADVKAIEDKEAADKKAAKAVEDEIDALPDPEKATAADKEKADKAAADLAALTDAQKALVPQEKQDKVAAVKKAADAAAEKEEEAKKEVEAFDQAVADVKAAKSGVDGKKAADKAKEAYDNLSDDAKALLTPEEQAAYEATQEAYKKDKTFESGEGVFRVLSNGEVTYMKPLHPENTWFVVPNQVKKNGFMYRVVKVSTKAFMGCTTATKIKIGKNVQSMGSYAFKNTPAMSKLIMLTSKLSAGKVTDTFGSAGKDGGAKLTVVVPSGKTATYDPLFKGEGKLNAKAKFTEED